MYVLLLSGISVLAFTAHTIYPFRGLQRIITFFGRAQGARQGLVCPNAIPDSYGQKTHPRLQGMGVPPTEASCRFPLIVLQQTTESFFATHNSVVPARPSIRPGEQQSVLLALVIALLVVMGHVLLQGSAQRSLPEQDEFRQAFLFYRSHPAFRIGVQIRTPSW